MNRRHILGALVLASAAAWAIGMRDPQDRASQIKPDTAIGHPVERGVEIGPSVLHVSREGIALTWTTREPRSGSARLIGPGGATREAVTPQGRFHKAVFGGLESGTTYAYQVDGRFRGEVETEREGSSQDFAVFGHPGGSQAAGTFPFGTVATALESAGVDFALCTGDACYFTTESSFKRFFFTPFKNVLRTRPIYLTAANHEAGYPTFDGARFAVYRRLFPHDFPGDSTPFYSFTRGNIEFFSCAYGPLAKGENEKQLSWLREGLAQSRAEFRILFFGDGHRPPGFNRAEFFEIAKAGGADLVFGGDGFGVRESVDDGVPYYFAGSGGKLPHHLFLVQQRDYELHLKLQTSLLQGPSPTKTFRSRRPKTILQDVTARLEVVAKGASATRSTCEVRNLGLDAASLDGVQIVVTNPFDTPASIEFDWEPRLPGVQPPRPGYYTEVYRVLEVGEAATLHFAIPPVTPRGGEPFQLDGLRIAMSTKVGMEGFNILDHMSTCSVFTDPLHREP